MMLWSFGGEDEDQREIETEREERNQTLQAAGERRPE